MTNITDNLRINEQKPLITPALIHHELPLPENATNLILDVRRHASNIIHGIDDRLLVIVGPCSIHDTEAALDYASRLQKQISRFNNELCIIMRVYFEKPRTTVGWKGLINDPELDNSFNINQGIRKARELLINLTLKGVPAGTEFLDTIIPQYLSDIVSWGAIGARTTESQIHREMASGLSVPVGFKNGTDGNIKIALDAITSSSNPHHFLGVTKDGIAAITSTKGNQDCHIILRGSSKGPNYHPEQVAHVVEKLNDNKIENGIMIDCSHGNSNKDHSRQKNVVEEISRQISDGNKKIVGAMIESNIVEGKQDINNSPLTYGQSVTDACVSWDETEILLQQLAEGVTKRRHHNQ